MICGAGFRGGGAALYPRLISGTPPACGGAMDASNILKRGLAQGSIKLFAATTAAEYRRAIEKGPDLKR